MKTLDSRLSQLENKQAHLDCNGGVDVDEMVKQFNESIKNGTVAGSEFVAKEQKGNYENVRK